VISAVLLQARSKQRVPTNVKCTACRYFKVNLYCDCQFWPDAGMDSYWAWDGLVARTCVESEASTTSPSLMAPIKPTATISHQQVPIWSVILSSCPPFLQACASRRTAASMSVTPVRSPPHGTRRTRQLQSGTRRRRVRGTQGWTAGRLPSLCHIT
jgi:hypothetical protein